MSPVYWLTCAVLALFSFSGEAQEFEYTVKHLLEEGNISKECLRMLVYQGSCSREDLESFKEDECKSKGCINEWKYIGSIGKYHIIHTFLEGEQWRIASLNVVKFCEDRLIKTSCLDGERWSEILGGAKIQGDCILYSQMTNGTSFFSYVTETNSELKALYPEKDEVSWFGTFGAFEWKCQLDADGTYTLELSEPLCVWMYSTDNKNRVDSIGGIVLMLGANQYQPLQREKLPGYQMKFKLFKNEIRFLGGAEIFVKTPAWARPLTLYQMQEYDYTDVTSYKVNQERATIRAQYETLIITAHKDREKGVNHLTKTWEGRSLTHPKEVLPSCTPDQIKATAQACIQKHLNNGDARYH